MHAKKFISAVLLAVPLLVSASDMDPELLQITRQYLGIAFTGLNASGRIYQTTANPDAARTAAGSISPDGSWPDIDYKNTSRSRWLGLEHTSRILLLARVVYGLQGARDSGISAPSNETDVSVLESAFHSALSYWITTRPKGPNWWSNEIGATLAVGQACLFMLERMSDDERARVADYLRGAPRPVERYTGQNKVWIAQVAFFRGLVAGDPEAVRAALDIIGSEIRVSKTVEGLQPDGSFHQHGNQEQFGNYGLSFLSTESLFSVALAGTSYAWSDARLDTLAFLLREGYSRVLWRARMEPSSLGRQLNPGASWTKARSALLSAEWLARTGRPDLVAIRDSLWASNFGEPGRPEPDLGGGTVLHDPLPPSGYKYFSTSGHSVYRTGRWMASVKMHSPDIVGTEIVNEDNFYGGHIADGALFTLVSGREYDDVYPLWNWRHVPGITSLEGVPPSLARPDDRNRSRFLHGAQAGSERTGGQPVGATAMTCDREGLVSHKTWIFTPEFVLCLGAGIASDRPEPVVTTVEQSLRNGPALCLDGAGWRELETGKPVSAPAARSDGSPRDLRLHHAGIGYIVRCPAGFPAENLTAAVESRSGDFRDFMRACPKTPRKGEVFECLVRHGAGPSGASYEYWVLPGATPEEVAAFDPGAHAEIVRNDAGEQIVRLLDYGLLCRVRRDGSDAGISFEDD